ncbi:MAG: HAD family hydrolase [Oscillibacter sp.]|jgi:HAD superfamily hydrolase (TIGR01549 family)|nr:HAD family hydrolase [Oscillibacter sp.]
MDMTKRYKAVFFDLGGTLRIALLDEPYMRHARRKMAEIAGTDMPFEDFYQMVEDRYEPYRKWALGENKESGDEELWCKWLLPDYDQARIRQICHELSFQYRQSKGRRVVVDGGLEVIKGLHERGYKLGIISNLIGEDEVPDWLEEDGLDQYFDTVILSSVCHIRKPAFEIYQLAAKEMGVELSDCVSVADNVKRDIPGAKKAGVGANIIFSSPEKKHPVEFTEENRPDAVVEDFREILNLLPPLV